MRETPVGSHETVWLCYFCPLAGSKLALGGLKVL